MTTTRCKFICYSVTKRKGYNATVPAFTYDAEFGAVTSGSEENKSFFAATPTGNLKLGTYTPDAFTPGKEYYIDITEVDA